MFLLAEQLLVRNVDCCVVTVSDRCMLCAWFRCRKFTVQFLGMV